MPLSHACMGRSKAIDKEKLPQLGYTTGRNSCWLANVARLLDAIVTPGQRIERDLSYGRFCDRKNDLLPMLQNVTVTDTRHTRHTCQRNSSHSSPTLVTLVTLVTDTRHRHTSHSSPTVVTLVTLVTDTRHTRHTCHRHASHLSPTLVTDTRHTRHTCHRHSSPTPSPTPTPASLVKLKNNIH